jgi:hypothetical protein
MDVTDECWHLAQNCERWAAAEKDAQVRYAFRAMARSFAHLAFQERDATKVAGLVSSDAEAALTLLALGLASEQVSVPASKLREGPPAAGDKTVDELHKGGDPRP